MHTQDLDTICYTAVFFDKKGKAVFTEDFQATDYWEACLKALDFLDSEDTAVVDFDMLPS